MEIREGFYVDSIKWERVRDKLWEKVLWKDEPSGTYVRLIRSDPGLKQEGVLVHDCDELIYVLHGHQTNRRNGKEWRAGTYSFFPQGQEHGPYQTEEGIICIEFRYYSK